MLIIAEETATYPPNGAIPNLETDGAACEAVMNKILPMLPVGGKEQVFGALINWSASTLLPERAFGTWAEAVRAATGYARGDVASATDSQRSREQAADTEELVKLSGAVRSTGRTDDVRIVQRDQSRRWANCGLAAFHIREQLAAHGGQLVLRDKQTFGPGTGGDLHGLLSGLPADAETVLVFDCQFPQVHNFLIEAHADGRRYLAQGYQGTYFAQWWLGATEGYSGTPTKEIVELRQRYGGGRPVGGTDFDTLLAGLATAVAGDWQQTATAWPKLPFNPDRQEVEGIRHRAGEPSLLIEVYEVTRPAVVRSALGSTSEESLSQPAAGRISGD
ncbi:hypothetical protein [Micromonospora cathayae]|uniref:Uncharacterized protein n=1 Tax=Micromonospora cathayae TaxID=3028804 RepID=A0ABY7ZYT6_9ACTN|nr:hypothetical protein [Micromonospora sp. HUAS 3]WDZ88282.1 hypothetical protein PVK37_09525 [Micromonospora sp. HUAS 3]